MAERVGRERMIRGTGELCGTLSDILSDRGLAGSGAVVLAVRRKSDPPGAVSWSAASVDPEDLDRGSGTEPRFLLYSITKAVLAALVCRLAESGCLGLDDPMARWFPDVPEGSSIRLRQVLAHGAGLPDYGSLPEYHETVARQPGQPWTFDQFADRTYRRGLAFRPGQGWAYSNPGYMLVRALIEREAGLPLAGVLDREVSGPLDLASWTVPGEVGDLQDLAPALSSAVVSGGPPRDVRSRYHPGWVSHGTVAGTATDTVRFLDALAGGSLLTPASLREMTRLVPVPTVQVPTGGVPWVRPSYGLGLMADPDSPLGPIWGHNGGGPGYTTSAFHAAGSGLTACALCAREEPFLAERLVFRALTEMAPLPPVPPKSERRSAS